jgi:hypothetical protein
MARTSHTTSPRQSAKQNRSWKAGAGLSVTVEHPQACGCRRCRRARKTIARRAEKM